VTVTLGCVPAIPPGSPLPPGPAAPTDGHGSVHLRPLADGDSAVIAAWRYPGPWARYDLPSDAVLRASDGYWAIDVDEVLIGFVCLGAEARVPGLPEVPGTVDVGVGLDPARVGQGAGAGIGRQVLQWIESWHGPVPLRVVVQTWNERSLRLVTRLGFVRIGTHVVDGAEYTVLRRPG
jgi:ribosomal-protein-alanine N-acetyltransferase